MVHLMFNNNQILLVDFHLKSRNRKCCILYELQNDFSFISLTVLFTIFLFLTQIFSEGNRTVQNVLSSYSSFCYDLFYGIKKVWLTWWSAVYTGIRRLTKCLDNLLKPSVQCKPAAFLFVLIPFVVWSRHSQLSGFACLKDFRKIISCECVFWTHWGGNSLSLQTSAALCWWSTKANEED